LTLAPADHFWWQRLHCRGLRVIAGFRDPGSDLLAFERARVKSAARRGAMARARESGLLLVAQTPLLGKDPA